jgi:hypothetical protein
LALSLWLQVSTLAGSTVAGFVDGVGLNASFDGPVDLAVDLNGVLFVIDNTFVVRQVTPNGQVSSVAGKPFLSKNTACIIPCAPADGVGMSAEFRTPIGITIDASGGMSPFLIDRVVFLR